jgi:hypothetical protein
VREKGREKKRQANGYAIRLTRPVTAQQFRQAPVKGGDIKAMERQRKKVARMKGKARQ